MISPLDLSGIPSQIVRRQAYELEIKVRAALSRLAAEHLELQKHDLPSDALLLRLARELSAFPDYRRLPMVLRTIETAALEDVVARHVSGQT